MNAQDRFALYQFHSNKMQQEPHQLKGQFMSSLQQQQLFDAQFSSAMMPSASFSQNYYPTQTMVPSMDYPMPNGTGIPAQFPDHDSTFPRDATGLLRQDMLNASNYFESNGYFQGSNSNKRSRDTYEHQYYYPAPPQVERSRKKKVKRADNMPRRPLSAYNFFFSEEREIILAVLPDPVDEKHISIEDAKDLLATHKFDAEEKEKLVQKMKENSQKMLGIHFEGDRIKKKHSKTHGKIAFQSLAKIVGERWRNLPKEKKEYYSNLAKEDLVRYNKQMASLQPEDKLE